MTKFGRRSLAAGLLLAWAPVAVAPALAQQAPAQKPGTVPSPTGGAAPPVGAAPVPDIPPSQLAAARDLVIASGMERSFKPMVPELRDQIAPMLTRTRPDLRPDLDAVIQQLTPEFDAKLDEMLNIAAGIYARRMSEPELKEAVAFFNSPAGKTYVEVQPKMLDELVLAMQAWTTTISNYMVSRVRDEMVKRGKQF